MLLNLDFFLDWFIKCASIIDKKKEYLTDLDSPIGDADHGANISRGFNVIVKDFNETRPIDIKTLFKNIAMKMMTKVGGASGMLYGNFFMQAYKTLPPNKTAITFLEFKEMLTKAIEGIQERGRAQLGDKTMIDVWLPFIQSFNEPQDISILLKEAERNMQKTIQLKAKKGRASYLGERSIGHQDPGATSTYYIIQALNEALTPLLLS